jgi:hypothetical protein
MELEESFLVLAISTGAFAQDHAAHLEEILIPISIMSASIFRGMR